VGQRELEPFRVFVYRETGIALSEAKRPLLLSRLARRIAELGVPALEDYLRYVVEGGDAAERTRCLDAICTNETAFFREPRHFTFLETRVFPEWEALAAQGRRPRGIRAWSAACSTGEEPYSLAMVLLGRFPPSSGWKVDVLGTDLCTRAVDEARAGVWPIEQAHEIPPVHLRAFMLKGHRTQDRFMKAGPEVRAVVRFEPGNLTREGETVVGPFDAVFCRNVLIYFDRASRQRALDCVLRHLAPGGYLFVGHSESLHGLGLPLTTVAATVYRRDTMTPANAG
jgi:chemotaxis protein methyltransferase CheR